MAKTIPQLKFESGVFNFTPVKELNAPKRRFSNLSFYPELMRVLETIKKEKAVPFEDALTIYIDKAPARDHQYLGQKNPAFSFLTHLRSVVKRMEIDDIVEVRKNGDRIHIVEKSNKK